MMNNMSMAIGGRPPCDGLVGKKLDADPAARRARWISIDSRFFPIRKTDSD
jgi:hypothetical protein